MLRSILDGDTHRLMLGMEGTFYKFQDFPDPPENIEMYAINRRGIMCLRDAEDAEGCGIKVARMENYNGERYTRYTLTPAQKRRYLIPIPSGDGNAGIHGVAAHYFEKCARGGAALERAWLADIATNSDRQEFVRDASKYWLSRKIEQLSKRYEILAKTSKAPRKVTKFCGSLADRLGFTQEQFEKLMASQRIEPRAPWKPDPPTEPQAGANSWERDQFEAETIRYEKHMEAYQAALERYEREMREFALKEHNRARFPGLYKGKLGEGAFRRTFPIGDNLIVKVCNPEGGRQGQCMRRDNPVEIAVFGKDAGIAKAKRAIAPRLYEYGDDYIIEERVSVSEDEIVEWMTETVGNCNENNKNLSFHQKMPEPLTADNRWFDELDAELRKKWQKKDEEQEPKETAQQRITRFMKDDETPVDSEEDFDEVVDDWNNEIIEEREPTPEPEEEEPEREFTVITSMDNHLGCLKDIEGGRFNYILDHYQLDDLHSGNFGTNSRGDIVITDPGFFTGNTDTETTLERRLKPSVRRPSTTSTACDTGTHPIPNELFDFEKGSDWDDKFGSFWDKAQRGRVPGVTGFIAPKNLPRLFSNLASL